MVKLWYTTDYGVWYYTGYVVVGTTVGFDIFKYGWVWRSLVHVTLLLASSNIVALLYVHLDFELLLVLLCGV